MFDMQFETTSVVETLITVEHGCLEYKGFVLTFTKGLLKNNYPYSPSLTLETKIPVHKKINF